MCINPITIPNPNKGHTYKGMPWIDTKSAYIQVPCGTCGECVANREMQLVQRMQIEELTNYLYYATITYDNKHIPYLITSTGYRIKYADWHDLQNTFKRMRKQDVTGRNFRYFAVSETGTKKGRPHFHIIFLVKKMESDDKYTAAEIEKKLYINLYENWSRNVGTGRKPIYEKNWRHVEYYQAGRLRTNFDLHHVKPMKGEKGTDNLGFYVLKYMLKSSEREKRLQQALKLNLPDEEYRKTWNIIKSRYSKSLNFGIPEEDSEGDKLLKKCIEIARKEEDSAAYYNPETGQRFPLARIYYKKGYVTTEDQLHWWTNSHTKDGKERLQKEREIGYRATEDLIKRVKEYQERQTIIEKKGDIIDEIDEYTIK